MKTLLRTSLTQALINNDNEDTFLSLIDRYEDIEARDQNGCTLLMEATIWGRTGIVLILIQRGASVNARSCFDDTALMLAAEGGHTQILRTLLTAGADVNCADINGMTALMWAAWKNQIAAVKVLVENGANINLRCKVGVTTLTYAKGELPPVSVGRYLSQLEKMGEITDRIRAIYSEMQEEQRRQRNILIEYLLNQGATE